MTDVQDELLTDWWLKNRWDDTVSAAVNLGRFRTWFFADTTGGDDD